MKIKSMTTKTISLVLALMLVFSAFALAGCANSGSASSEQEKTSAISASPKSASKGSDKYEGDVEISENAVKGVITVKDYGDIEFALLPDIAPKSVANFEKLAKSGFYDGLTFHRIIEDFMIQGGDPLGTGMGGSDDKVEGEFAANGHENNLKHLRGVISMARSQDYNSGSSQFFIVQTDYPSLDGQYAAFGVVTKGMSVVDEIAADAKPTDGNGSIAADQQPVIEKITISE